MKVLICLALVGAILAEVCDAQACTNTQYTDYTTQYATCDNPDLTPEEATCLADACSCCTTALNEGESNSLYECCMGFAGLLKCGSSSITEVCNTLPNVNGGGNGGDGNGGDGNGGDGNGGDGSGAAAFAVNAALVLVCAAVTQLFL